MNRKIILLPLAMAAILGLVACNETSSQSTSTATSVASVTSTKSGTSVSTGTSASTGTSVTSTSSVDKTITSVAKLIEWTGEQDSTKAVIDGDTVWTVTGILEGLSHTDKYGDAYLTDGEQTALIYGSTTTATCISGDPGALAFKNPADAVTTLADYNNGEKVTLKCIREAYFGKLELLGYFVSHVADDTKYTASVAEGIEHGTVTIDKTTGIAYGETVTATVAAADGYKIDSVFVTNRQGVKVNCTAGATAGTYTFAAQSANLVGATFASNAELSSTITVDNLALPLNAYTNSSTATIDNVAWSQVGCGNYGTGIQLRINATTGTSEFHNTAAFAHAVKSVTLNFNATKTHTKDVICLTSGTAVVATPNDAKVIGAASIVNNVYTASFAQADAVTFLSIGHHSVTTGSEYIDSVKIVFYA